LIGRHWNVMITLTRGNILEARTEALVNTVNTVGVMGKGIALQFKRAFPENYLFYTRACERGEVQPGRMLVFETGWMSPPRYIINFPTKRHWRSPSRIEDVETGLHSLVQEITSRRIRSIALPPLGCGNGGLDWNEVRPRIEQAVAHLEDVDVRLYEPGGTPDPRFMPDRRKKPPLTPARAILIELLFRYGELGFSRTLLEAQKLAYFLQETGEPLKLRYVRGKYGPYAHNLDKALQQLEGHYIVGLGDAAHPRAEIDLLPGAVEEARKILSAQPESRQRFDRVASLIEGFETPYGLELLASVHWVSRKEATSAVNPDQAAGAIRSWTPRKAHLFQPDHVRTAWERLTEQGW
jgi:O-acetyl-ADP-ribose deacetylase (regulator of RNase III)